LNGLLHSIQVNAPATQRAWKFSIDYGGSYAR
jgi:hypothetical protein